MAEFLTTNGISFHIEKIITDATKELVLVSPFLQLSKTLLERLKDASRRDVSIKIIYGKDKLNLKEENSLKTLDNLELYYFDNLHAKCYFNESKLIISSMNVYEFSEKNNREMGVLVYKAHDESLYNGAVQETKSIIVSSQQIILKPEKSTNKTKRASISKNNYSTSPEKGFCIRCKESIAYNTDMPYCNRCFKTWSNFENANFEEQVCHCCCSEEFTTMTKPECYKCFINNK